MALRLMCITAHPDDESGAFGGALVSARERGAETSVICLTEGRAASHRGPATNEEELAALRRKEFAAALSVLGVTHGEVLQYPDGGLLRQDFCDVVTALIERIRRYRPQVVLTFGGDGSVNRHPDHSMTSFFATAAFHWAGRELPALPLQNAGPPYAPQKLYYTATPFLAYAASETPRISLVPASLVLELGSLKQKTIEAFLQHSTQAAIFTKVREAYEKLGGEERYSLAAIRGIRQVGEDREMFQGVVDDV